MELTEIYQDVYALCDKIYESKIYLDLKTQEKAMLDNKNLAIKFKDYKNLQEQYLINKDETLLKQLHALKLEIDENMLVRDYKKAYFNFTRELLEIKNIIFKDLISIDDI